MTTAFNSPHTMKFQLAPCQIPVANHTTSVTKYTGIRLPAAAPKCLRQNVDIDSTGMDADSG